MKITDKQRIDFMQKRLLRLNCWEAGAPASRGCIFEVFVTGYEGGFRFTTLRKTVDKAIKAYMGGKK